jgi:uncharacterized protein (UPF0305 family)
MTPRERKYHKRKYWERYIDRMMKMSPAELQEERRKRHERLHYYAMKNGRVESSTEPTSATITLTKYNLPNNSSLQGGQLN